MVLMTMTSQQWRRFLEDSFMRKYGITRRQARIDYIEYIERDMVNPPEWIEIKEAV
jgi:hypothetical protein